MRRLFPIVVGVSVLAVACGGWRRHYSFTHREVGVGGFGVSVPVESRAAKVLDEADMRRSDRRETVIVTGVRCANTETRVVRKTPKVEPEKPAAAPKSVKKPNAPPSTSRQQGTGKKDK